MSSNKADNITQLKKTPVLFSDFFDDFTVHPISNDLGRLVNDQSIKQSIRNLILTNYGERLFQPSLGSNVNRTLFEPDDNMACQDLQYHIQSTLSYNEPRINLLNVIAISDPDNNKINVNIIFSIINSTQVQSLTVFLQRAR